jgi:hypothetical protein
MTRLDRLTDELIYLAHADRWCAVLHYVRSRASWPHADSRPLGGEFVRFRDTTERSIRAYLCTIGYAPEVAWDTCDRSARDSARDQHQAA